MEAHAVSPPQAAWLRRFFHVLIEPRSYLTAIYLATAFPLGLTYFGAGERGNDITPWRITVIGFILMESSLIALLGLAVGALIGLFGIEAIDAVPAGDVAHASAW